MTSSEFRRSVVASVVASLIVLLLLQPLLGAVAGPFVRILSSLFARFSDSLYDNAALGHRNYLDVMFFGIIVAFAIGTTVTGTFLSYISDDIRERTATRIHKLVLRSRIPAAVLTIMFAFSLLSTVWVDLQINTSFQQRITVLAPEVPDSTVKRFRARWARMRTRADYERILLDMDSVAEAQSIRLPKPLYR